MKYQLSSAPADVIRLLPAFVDEPEAPSEAAGPDTISILVAFEPPPVVHDLGNGVFEVSERYNHSTDLVIRLEVTGAPGGGTEMDVTGFFSRSYDGLRSPAPASLDHEVQDGFGEWAQELDAYVAARSVSYGALDPTVVLASRVIRVPLESAVSALNHDILAAALASRAQISITAPTPTRVDYKGISPRGEFDATMQRSESGAVLRWSTRNTAGVASRETTLTATTNGVRVVVSTVSNDADVVSGDANRAAVRDLARLSRRAHRFEREVAG